MATGAAHYIAGELWIKSAEKSYGRHEVGSAEFKLSLAMAHFAAAQVAATVLAAGMLTPDDAGNWHAAMERAAMESD